MGYFTAGAQKYYFSKSSGAIWPVAQEFDFNLDGQVNITDLVFAKYVDAALVNGVLLDGILAGAQAAYFTDPSPYDLNQNGQTRIDDILIAAKIQSYLNARSGVIVPELGGEVSSAPPGSVDKGTFNVVAEVGPWYSSVQALPAYAPSFPSSVGIGVGINAFSELIHIGGGIAPSGAYYLFALPSLERYSFDDNNWHRLPITGVGGPAAEYDVGALANSYFFTSGLSQEYGLIYRISTLFEAQSEIGATKFHWRVRSWPIFPAHFIYGQTFPTGQTQCCFNPSGHAWSFHGIPVPNSQKVIEGSYAIGVGVLAAALAAAEAASNP